VPPAAADTPRRIPFAADDADEVIAFCVAQDSAYDAPLLRRLLLDLTSDARGVIVVRDAAGIALVATVVDRARNGADAASLETLGVRAPLEAPDLARLVIEPAIAFSRAGERRALHVPLPPALMPADGAEQVLRDAGFAHAYDTYEMRRPPSAPDAASLDVLPDGWCWAALDESRVEAAHAALAEMFHGAPSFSLGPLDGFRRAVASGATTWRVLLDGQRIAGLLHVARHETPGGQPFGEVRTIGRAPAYRGRGLGPRLLREALNLLGGDGREIRLTVEAKNVDALALYRRFGFEPASQTPVFALTLR
jgi:ribosomal protein S18 acetylase RimI-like enzyme